MTWGKNEKNSPTARVAKNGRTGIQMLGQVIQLSLILTFSVAPPSEGVESPGVAQDLVRVSSIEGLRRVMTKSHQHIKMAPGTYVVSDLLDSRTVFHLSGSDNLYDLSGVTIQIPLSTLRTMTSFSSGATG